MFVKNRGFRTELDVPMTSMYDQAVIYTFPAIWLNILLVSYACFTSGYRSAWYSLKLFSISEAFFVWRVQIQFARATASWIAVNAPAPPAGFSYFICREKYSVSYITLETLRPRALFLSNLVACYRTIEVHSVERKYIF